MFNIHFNVSPEYIKNTFTTNLDKQIEYLKNLKDKTFKLEVDDKSYTIRFELDDSGEVRFYIENECLSDRLLAVPSLKLNISDILLPESMSINTKKDNSRYNDIEYTPYKVVGYNKLSDKELDKIYKKVQETGLLNILKK